jgi:hypothetical protein
MDVKDFTLSDICIAAFVGVIYPVETELERSKRVSTNTSTPNVPQEPQLEVETLHTHILTLTDYALARTSHRVNTTTNINCSFDGGIIFGNVDVSGSSTVYIGDMSIVSGRRNGR